MEQQKPYMSAREVALTIPMPYATVLAKVHKGELNSMQMAGHYAVPTDEAVRFIAQQKRLVRCTPELVDQLEAQVSSLKARIAELEGAV